MANVALNTLLNTDLARYHSIGEYRAEYSAEYRAGSVLVHLNTALNIYYRSTRQLHRPHRVNWKRVNMHKVQYVGSNLEKYSDT